MISHDFEFPAEEAVRGAESGLLAFPVPVRPAEGESLLGLVARAGLANGRDRVSQVCAVAGIRSQYPAQLPFASLEPEVLAALLGTEIGEIESRRYRLRTDPDRLVRAGLLHGVEVRRKHLSAQHRRFSPTSLRERLLHRSIWDLKPLPCCLSGGDALTASCQGCGGSVGWNSTALHLCGRPTCRFDLRESQTERVSGDVLERIRIVADGFSHDAGVRAGARSRLAADLRDIPSGDLLDLAIFFGICAADPAGRTVATRRRTIASGNYSRWTAFDLASGADVLAGWPASFERLVDACIYAADQRAGRYGLRKFLGPLVEAVDPDAFPGSTVRSVEKAVSDHVGCRPDVVLRPDENDRFRPGGPGITLVAAATKHGIGPEHLARMVRRPGFVLAGTGGKGMPLVLDAAKVEAAVASYRDMVETEAVRTRYGLDACTVERLVAAGWLLRADGPERDLRIRRTDYLRRSSVEALANDLEQRSRGSAAGGTTLAMALLPAIARPEARAEVLLAILEGKMTLLRVDLARKRLGYRLIVDRAEVHAFLFGGSASTDDTVTLQFASERLGLKWEVTRDLCREVGVGLVRDGKSHRLTFRDLEGLMRAYIPGGEVAARIGTIARHLDGYLRPLGIEPRLILKTRSQRLYDRAEIETKAGQLMRSAPRQG